MDDLRTYQVFMLMVILAVALRRAAGRMAPKAAIAPLVFLASRWPVVVAWIGGTLAMLFLLWRGALEQGRDPTEDYWLMIGLSGFCGLGFAALAVGPAWMVLRAFASAPAFELRSGETVLREFAANHFLNGEARGGKLRVTSDRLVFTPHRFNVQMDQWSARLQEIAEVSVEGERLLTIKVAGDPKVQWVVIGKPAELAEQLRKVTG